MRPSKKNWKQLTEAQRRVAVAKDVIRSLNSGLYRAGHQGYVSRSADNRGRLASDSQEYALEAMNGPCTVCARGAMMISKLAKYNHGPKYLGMLNSASGTEDALYDCFDYDQLRLIEVAYEVSLAFAPFSQYKAAHAAYEFGKQHRNSTSRMIAIMQNIIDHKGTFRPEVAYEVVEVEA